MTCIPRIDEKEIILRVFADTHIGSCDTNLNMFDKAIQEVYDTPNMYAVFWGDILQFDLRAHKVGDIYSQVMPPDKQEEYAENAISLIAEKTLAIMPGNHENRSKEDNQPIKRIARHLGLNFCDGEAFLKLPVKDQCYTIYGIHGYATTEQSIITEWSRMANIVDADIYVVAHAHKPLYKPGAYYRTDLYNKCIPMVKKHYIACKSFQERGLYPQRNAMAPTLLGTVDIRLQGKTKHVSVEL